MNTITGTFYRAIDPMHMGSALDGSRGQGRFNAVDQPTLYLSSSRDGVAAAMIKHTSANDPARTVIAVRVENARVFDLRDADSPDHAGISLDDATCDWQQQLREGLRPQSWSVRNTIEESGAHGLIDPSRKSPGLWHLVLFTWNTPSAPAVTVEER